MTRIFNIKNNPTLKLLSKDFDDRNIHIVEYADAFHLYCPINIDSSVTKNNDLLMKSLRRLRFSINGYLITTDNKVIEIDKTSSHAFIHVTNNTPLISSYREMIKKIQILSMCLRVDETEYLNNKISTIDLSKSFSRNSRVKLSFLEVMKALGLTFQKRHLITDQLLLPGGRILAKDKSIFMTLSRELREEIGLKNLVIKPNHILYHNIFDKINEQFYQNIIIISNLNMDSANVVKGFKKNGEVNNIVFIESNSLKYNKIKFLIEKSQRNG